MIAHPHVVLVDGQWVIENTKIPAFRLYFLHKRWSFEEIFRRYTALGRSEILSAIAFCYDNPELFEQRNEGHKHGTRPGSE